ncbi:hypothetical protein CB1_000058002, partial [Camelus ferus]
MKVKIKCWNGVATWLWVANDENCGICRMAFNGCCPACECPLPARTVPDGRAAVCRRAGALGGRWWRLWAGLELLLSGAPRAAPALPGGESE